MLLQELDYKLQHDANFRVWRGIVSLVLYKQDLTKDTIIANRQTLELLINQYRTTLADTTELADRHAKKLQTLMQEYENFRVRAHKRHGTGGPSCTQKCETTAS
jgi:hypothetical protein